MGKSNNKKGGCIVLEDPSVALEAIVSAQAAAKQKKVNKKELVRQGKLRAEEDRAKAERERLEAIERIAAEEAMAKAAADEAVKQSSTAKAAKLAALQRELNQSMFVNSSVDKAKRSEARERARIAARDEEESARLENDSNEFMIHMHGVDQGWW
jgi:hypothetical protein